MPPEVPSSGPRSSNGETSGALLAPLAGRDRQALRRTWVRQAMSACRFAPQGTLAQDVVDLFADALSTEGADLVHDCHHTVDKGHRRLERRQSWTIADPACIAYLIATGAWPGLCSIGMEDRGMWGWRAGDRRTPFLHLESGRQHPGLWTGGTEPLGDQEWSRTRCST